MMAENKKTPQIRFAGFTAYWKKCELGELGSFKNGMNFSKEAMGKGYPFVNLQNIFGRNIIDINNIGLSEATDAQLREYNLQQGDVLFVRSSVKLEGVGEAALVPKHLENTTYSGFIIRFRDESNMDDNFKRFVFGIKSVRDQIMAKATNSANKNISQDVLDNLELLLPSGGEQQIIGAFFSNLDSFIIFHQRKYEKLNQIKKSMLEKMFPRNGSNVPEIRFAGFTDPWKWCKIGECFTERKESMPDGELISVTINEGIKKFLELGRHDNSNDDKSKYKKVCVGDIAYNSMRMWQGASGYSPYEGIVSPAYTVISPIRDIVDSKCISYLFKREDMTHTFQTNSQGITSDNWNLKYPALSEIKVIVSPYLDEQRQISNCLSKLDNLITLHKQKYEKLKQIKKSLLEKMFV